MRFAWSRNWSHGSVGRAHRSHRWGHRFESCCDHQHGKSLRNQGLSSFLYSPQRCSKPPRRRDFPRCKRFAPSTKLRDFRVAQGKIYRMIGELTHIRRENRASDARADVRTFDTGSDHVLGIGRYYDGQKLLALLNFSTSEQTASTDGQGCLTNLCSGEAAGDTVRLLPCGFVWLAASAQA